MLTRLVPAVRSGAVRCARRHFAVAPCANLSLSSLLKEEWDGERENVLASDELNAALDALAARGATLETSAGGGRASVTLAADVVASFDCRDVGDLPPDEAPGGCDPIELEVVLGSPAGDRLVFECVAATGPRIDAVSFFAEGADDADPGVYDGPKFDELDARVQAGFYALLADAGVDVDFCAAVNAYAAHKEAVEYAGWLANVGAFLGERGDPAAPPADAPAAAAATAAAP